MDECAIRKEFEEWAERNLFHMRAVWFARSHVDGAYRDCRTQDAWVAWLESARRADKRAREDCVRTCTALAGDNFHDAYDCANAIRDTIKEEPS